MNAIAILKGNDFWTPARRFLAGQYTGRKPGRLPGGHVMDLADLMKAIVLCADCVRKFHSAKAGYVTKRNLPFVRTHCDGCKTFSTAHLLVHHTLANNT